MTAGATSPWQEVGARCYRRRYESYDLNIGLVQGDDGLLLIDTRCHEREATELLDELRVFGTRPIRWIVNTHAHFDHTWGNATIARAAPGVEIWGHRVMRDELLLWSDDTRNRLIRERDEWADDLAAVEVMAPDHLVDDVAVIDLGDRAVRIMHFGPAHTGGDLVMFVDDVGAVYAGDLVEEGAPPVFGDDCHPLGWPVCNTAMLEHIGPEATVVPGHGDIVDRGFVEHQCTDLAATAELFRELRAAGVDVDDAITAGHGQWPFPEAALVHAAKRAYAALA